MKGWVKEVYETGYFDAIEDVEKAMKEAEVDTWHEGVIGFNDPKLFVEAL